MAIDPEFAGNYERAWRRFSESEQEHFGGFRTQQWRKGDLYVVVSDRSREEEGIRKAGEVVHALGARLVRQFPTTTAIAVSYKYAGGEIEPIPTITFFVGKKLPERELGKCVIPKEIEGIPTDVVEAGVPQLQQKSPQPHSPGARSRPAQPGMSIAHERVTSGTFGCLLEDGHGKSFILSCAHVLSDAAGLAGDVILQPAPHYGGVRPQDEIGRLTKTLPLWNGICIADAAIAEANPANVLPNVQGIGKPAGVRTSAPIGLAVQKSGDQTGVTTGLVVGIKATIPNLQINGAANVSFDDVIITTPMSIGGDSGSLLMDNTLEAVGMLFGGLVIGSQPTISWYNPLEPILTHFGLSLVK
jgi:hypothetical protein